MKYNSREVSQAVRDALDFQASYVSGKDPLSKRPKAEILSEKITNEIIPTLKEVYLDMIATSVEWKQKGFQESLQNASASNGLLAGFPVSIWISWGELMLKLLEFVGTPQESLGGTTAEDLLLDDYIPMTEEQWKKIVGESSQPIDGGVADESAVASEIVFVES